MTEANTRNPAFPTANIRPENCGMTLRDYFAAAAMQGALAERSAYASETPNAYARWAYQMADAMLKARQS